MTDQAVRDVLGYRTIGGGGITNQKLAFIGLLLEAYESKKPIILPHFLVMDQIERRHQKFDFDNVFDIGSIVEFCSRYGVIIGQIDFEQLPAGYDQYFWKIYHVLRQPSQIHQDEQKRFVVDLLGSLKPRVRDTFLLRSLRNTVANSDSNFIVAQFRIEADWQEHCQNHLNQIVPEQEVNFLNFEEILTKIKNSLPKTKTIFVICDEKSMPVSKNRMKQVGQDYFDLHLVFKSDYLSQFEEKLYTELHLSLLDFELATFADYFVGISRSTFSCLATLEKFAREGQMVKNHYIYNIKGRQILERTDNGFFWDAESATHWVAT